MSGKDFTKQTLAIVLAGGNGRRLQSLTQWHAKPAVPFGGKYRSIDFTLSNCINSDIRKICILTQYKSHSLNKHIHAGWDLLRPQLDEFIELIPAQQRLQRSWYQGTADAVYQNIDIFRDLDPAYILVLAGDHIYKMDYRPMIEHHVQRAADMTVGCVEMPMQEAGNFGVMSIDDQFRITDFREKPGRRAGAVEEPTALVSMGIYVFNAEFLYRRLCLDATDDNSSHDFGRDIIPGLVGRARLSAFPFRDRVTGQPGYWRDVGTIDAYFDANMDLCEVTPRLNFYDSSWPIWTYQQQLPPAKFVFNDAQRRGIAADSIVSNGCIVSGAWVVSSVLSDNVRVNSYSTIEHSVILNNAVIGRNCHIRNAIIDSDCHVPPNTMIGLDYAEDCARFQLSPKGVVLVAAEMLKECPARLARTEQVA